MKQPDRTGDLFPDAAAIQAALERRTRDALIQRLGPVADEAGLAAPGVAHPVPPSIATPDPADRRRTRGIGFGVELVRAIFAGRKTQTRRLVRPPPTERPDPDDCPAARPGELLYVREPWLRSAGTIRYAADETAATGLKYRPGMYMPRAAARLWLRVLTIRVERLQSISDADVLAEGLPAGQTLAAVWDTFYTAPGERYGDDPWVWAITFGVETDRR